MNDRVTVHIWAAMSGNIPADICAQQRFIRAVWSESSAKDAKLLHVDNEGSGQTADVQTDLSLRWSHKSKGTFSHVTAHDISI